MTRHTPFEELDRLVEDLQSRFEETRRPLGDDLDWRRRGDATMDVVEYDDEYVVAVDLPGFDADDVDVRLTDRELTVTADRESVARTDEPRDGGQYVRRDRVNVAARQSVTFPRAVDSDSASASLDDGVLTVTVPKHAGENGTHVDVE